MDVRRKNRYQHNFGAIVACVCFSLLAACSMQQQQGITQIDLSSTAQTTANTRTVTMPQTDTSCPADGTARAAVMRPLNAGTQQNLVYIFNDVPQNTSTAFGRLRRYTLATGQKTEIITSGLAILKAQISADGQWVLFISTIDPRINTQHAAKLQLVRMDGQGLQTLYCFGLVNATHPADMQWSTDQKSILLSGYSDNASGTISLLDVATGTLHKELNILDSSQLYAYHLVSWLDSTHAYIVKRGQQGPEPPITLYSLDINANRDLNGNELKEILTHSVRMSYLALDSNYAGTKLFLSYCLLAASPFVSNLSSGPALGGPLQQIYQSAPNLCIQNMRVIADHTLLLQVEKLENNDTYTYHLWTMNTDGSNVSVVTDLPGSHMHGVDYNLNDTSQFPWSNVSRDGNDYALFKQTTLDSGQAPLQAILFGSLHGGLPTQIASLPASGPGSIALVGWTTF